MLREILQALKGSDALGEMIAQIGEMLDAGEWMFEKAVDSLTRQADWAEVADDLYSRDKRVNEIEQAVREGIVTHLSLGHESDLTACLILMNVVKDAERIGDYCKNIFEIGRFYRHEFGRPEYQRTLDDIRRSISPMFQEAKKAFLEADKKLADNILDTSSKLKGRCDVVIRQLLSVHDQIPPDEAVAYVLTARFYKRVAAHLSNIATSVVSPIPMLDYGARKLK
jgi:phosphate transport system protein